jgi:hypothetical protein
MNHDRRRNRLLRAGLLAGWILAVAGTASAGEISGVLVGEGATGGEYALPSAKLDLCLMTTGECRTTFTDSEGGFRFDGVAAGQYDLKTPSRLGGVSSREFQLPSGVDNSFLKVIAK